MSEIAGFIGFLVLAGLVAKIVYDLNWREPVVPGYLELHELDSFLYDYEPDTRSLKERIEEQRRLLKFEGLLDDDDSGVKPRT